MAVAAARKCFLLFSSLLFSFLLFSFLFFSFLFFSFPSLFKARRRGPARMGRKSRIFLLISVLVEVRCSLGDTGFWWVEINKWYGRVGFDACLKRGRRWMLDV